MTPVTQGRFSRWVGCAALLGTLALTGTNLIAEETVVAMPATNPATFSIVSPNQRAAWQKKLTLGPGDVLNFGLYGEPELARNGQRVPVDFQKLFLEGDLTQNVPLEPDDYIYFAGAAEKEVTCPPSIPASSVRRRRSTGLDRVMSSTSKSWGRRPRGRSSDPTENSISTCCPVWTSTTELRVAQWHEYGLATAFSWERGPRARNTIGPAIWLTWANAR